MRKITLAIVLLFVIHSSHAATIIPGKDPLASNFMIPLFGTDKMISLDNFSKLTVKEYQFIAGRKMSFKERVTLKINQFAVKKVIREDGTVNTGKMRRYGFFSRWHWHWGGFALGFLIVLGPIIALFFRDEYKWDRFWTAFVTMSALVGLILSLLATSWGV